MALGFGFMLFMTPFIIRGLGKEEFGLYCLIGVFSAYLSLLQFGMGGTIIRYVAKYNAENDERGRENFLAMVLVLHVAFAALTLLVGAVLITQLDSIFAASLTSAGALGKARIMLAVLSVSLAACSITNVFVGALSGYEEFIFPRVISTVSWCGRILATIVILMQSPADYGCAVLENRRNNCWHKDVHHPGCRVFDRYTAKRFGDAILELDQQLAVATRDEIDG